MNNFKFIPISGWLILIFMVTYYAAIVIVLLIVTYYVEILLYLSYLIETYPRFEALIYTIIDWKNALLEHIDIAYIDIINYYIFKILNEERRQTIVQLFFNQALWYKIRIFFGSVLQIIILSFLKPEIILISILGIWPFAYLIYNLFLFLFINKLLTLKFNTLFKYISSYFMVKPIMKFIFFIYEYFNFRHFKLLNILIFDKLNTSLLIKFIINFYFMIFTMTFISLFLILILNL